MKNYTNKNNRNIVYSTETLVNEIFSKKVDVDVKPSEQNIRLHLERKRGGKILTRVKGFSESVSSLNIICKELKKICGAGGTVKNNEILIQGNKREIIKKILTDKNYNVKLSGG
jgi:translation initiation factor 1